MGLFGNNKEEKAPQEEEKKVEEFVSIIVESDNIPREIKSISSAKNVPLSELDFKIIKVKTQIMTSREEGWQIADKETLDKLSDKDFLINPDLKIKQLYKVEIFKVDTNIETKILPQIILGANKLLTKVIVTIKKDVEVKYYSKLEHDIIEDINKRKIKAGIVVGLHDENMYKEVKKAVSSIRVNGILDEDIMFVACQGVDPIEPVNDEFIYHYKKSLAKEDENGRVDYSKRGYVLAVSQGDCIMEYIKPQVGTPGRNCQGNFLEVKKPKNNSEIHINFTENIIKKEDDEKIKYIANRNGYVVEDGGTYDIKDEMEVDEISFKSTGSIETDLDSEVTINIKEDDVFKDAVGPGMSVETYKLNVEGNVGSGAKIKSEKLSIGGQTHKTSYIEAKEAKITIHRGEFVGENVEIDRLEGGKVIGDNITIKQAIGGEIIGKNITIEELSSNVTITSSDLIDIKELKGTNNKFIIDPSVTKEFNKEIEDITKKIKDISLKLKQMPRLLEEKKRVLDKVKPTIVMVQEKIKELKDDGKKPPVALLNKIKEFQKKVNEYNTSLKHFKDEKLKLKNLKEDLAHVQNRVFSAKVVNHSPWKEFNEIKFKLISPPVEKIYNTKENEIIREITLKETGDDEYEIKRSSEYSN
jgi:cell fate (sporulation/competence/biofilm development) regulator YlbF (YheA/YmcA/DUF963 family)